MLIHKLRSDTLRGKLLALLFIAPAFLIFAVILWYPIFLGFKMSFQNIDFVRGNTFTGFRNYDLILNDPLLLTAVRNTVYYMVLSLVFGYFIPILTAIISSELRMFGGFIRSVVYFPSILPAIAIYALWYWMFEANGLINSILGSMHLGPLPFLNSESSALPSLTVMDTWLGFGGTTLIYLAAVKGISEELYEAAEIDGANVRRRIWHITLPGIKNIMLIILVLQLIGAAQVFGGPFVMTNGGPANSTTTILYLIYQYAFVNFRIGPAAAIGVLLFLALVVMSAIFLWLNRKDDMRQVKRRRGGAKHAVRTDHHLPL
jgi:multiple sugar transport system permease protein